MLVSDALILGRLNSFLKYLAWALDVVASFGMILNSDSDELWTHKCTGILVNE